MAVGTSTTTSASNVVEHTLTEYWNGTTWTIVTSPNPTGLLSLSRLSGVSCPNPSDCTAVGSSITLSPTSLSLKTLTEHWNGMAWTITASPDPTTEDLLVAVSCSNTSTCTAVGNNATGTTFVEQWNGTTWAAVTTTNPSGAASADLSGVSCPTITSCFAVGSTSTNESSNTLAERGG
jgi:hypothetical protein